MDSRQKITSAPGYQVPYAAAVKKAVKGTGVAVTSVGMISSGKQAQGYLDDGSVDAVMVARGFLKDPNLVWHWADELDIDIHVAAQCKFLVLDAGKLILTIARWMELWYHPHSPAKKALSADVLAQESFNLHIVIEVMIYRMNRNT